MAAILLLAAVGIALFVVRRLVDTVVDTVVDGAAEIIRPTKERDTPTIPRPQPPNRPRPRRDPGIPSHLSGRLDEHRSRTGEADESSTVAAARRRRLLLLGH